MDYPLIIQGGMGAGVSGWRLAKTVSKLGQLGVVSGIALDLILTRRLQLGDPGGHIRRAMDHFPDSNISNKIIDKYFVPGGIKSGTPFKKNPNFSQKPSRFLQELTIMGNFVEVFLAKEGHENPVGINFMEKVQLPIIYSIYGAMLAGVDYLMIGAGIPRDIPYILDQLVENQSLSIKLDVVGADPTDNYRIEFNPENILQDSNLKLKRPRFFAIVSSDTLAKLLANKSSGKINGFVIEDFTAGGHNAMPRQKNMFNDQGEPIYGKRDIANLEKMKILGLPFWLAGSFGSPEGLEKALKAGAQGVQVGTAFAFSKESGYTENIKRQSIQCITSNGFKVLTDPLASPTGYPFKIFPLAETVSEDLIYQKRPRICDLCYLRRPFKQENGVLAYRCPAEPIEDYVKTGGDIETTTGKKCLCNALMANIGLAQTQSSQYTEKPLITAGYDLATVKLLNNGNDGNQPYTAEDVINYILGKNHQ